MWAEGGGEICIFRLFSFLFLFFFVFISLSHKKSISRRRAVGIQFGAD